MDAFELLKADHRKVAKLFDQLESGERNTKLDLFKQINRELDLHAHIEETILYPALEKPEETHELTLEAYEEHKVVKTLLAELAGATAATDEWQAKAKVLRENVEHHVEEEEGELFKKADDALADEQIEALGTRMEAEKALQQGRPSPKRAGAGRQSEPRKSDAKEPGILSKKAAKKASTKKSGKSSGASASKRSSSAQGLKRASRAGAPKKSRNDRAGSSTKKTAQKRASKK